MKRASVVDIRTADVDESVIKKNRQIDTLIRVLSVICAVLIWSYIVLSDSAVYNYQNVSVNIKSETIVKSKGYTISYDNLKVNFTVQGSAAKISQLSFKSVEVYADLSKVDLSTIEEGQSITVPLPIVYKLPTNISGLTLTEKSQEYIDIIITKKSSNS